MKSYRKVHFIGITGAFSSFCADYLLQHGSQITASELNQDNRLGQYWRSRGILYPGGHDEQHISPDLDLVVYPNGPLPNNPECRKAEELGLNTMTVGQLTGEISRQFQTIAVAGTHGKTTTTALIVWLMHQALGQTPNFVLGMAEDYIKKLDRNYLINPNSPYLVLEACEYKKQFLDRAPQPKIAVITHIDIDHTDFYPDQSAYNQAFVEFLSHADTIVIDAQGKNEQQVIKQLTNKHIVDINHYRQNTAIHHPLLPGQHNQENFLRALTAGHVLGIDRSQIIRALKSFPGVANRFDLVKQTAKQSLIFRDYAHNPPKLRALLQGARAAYPERKIILVFQPHSFERVSSFKTEFARALKLADRLIITPIHLPIREPERFKQRIDSLTFVKHVQRENPYTYFATDFDQILHMLNKLDHGASVVIFASAGDLLHQLSDRLDQI